MALIAAGTRLTPIGLEIGEKRLRALQFDRTMRAQRVRAMRTIPLATDVERPLALRAALEELKGNGFKGRNVVASLPTEETLVRPIRLPEGVEPGKPEFAQAWLNEARNALPYDVRDAVLDYLELGFSQFEGENRYAVLLVAAKRERVWQYVQALQASGFRCLRLDLAGSAIARINQARKDAYAIVDLDEQQTVVSVAQGPKLLFSRVLRRGLVHLTGAVADALRVTHEQAETILRAYGFSTEPREPVRMAEVEVSGRFPAEAIPATLTEICARELEYLVQELDRTFRYFQLQPCGCVVEQAVVCCTSIPPHMVELIAARLRLQFEPAVDASANIDGAYVKAAGLALGASA